MEDAICNFRQKTAEQIRQLDTTSCLVLAAAVDPRFKHLRFLDEGKIESVKQEITKRMDEAIMDITSDSGEPTQVQRYH